MYYVNATQQIQDESKRIEDEKRRAEEAKNEKKQQVENAIKDLLHAMNFSDSEINDILNAKKAKDAAFEMSMAKLKSMLRQLEVSSSDVESIENAIRSAKNAYSAVEDIYDWIDKITEAKKKVIKDSQSLFPSSKWIFLARENGRTLLISKDIVDCYAFHEKKDTKSADWEKCTLRRYLNGAWFKSYLTVGQRKHIIATRIEYCNRYNERKQSKDKVFLLSSDEVVKYMTVEKKVSSSYSTKRSEDYEKTIATYRGQPHWWWLRSSYENDFVTCVSEEGYINKYGAERKNGAGGVRPAFWAKLP